MTKPVALSTTNKKRVQATLAGKKPCLVLFHMHGCRHCDEMMPVWQAAAKQLETQKIPVAIITVEYANMPMLPHAMQEVRGFPTVQMWGGGKLAAEFSGFRTPDILVDFAKSACPPKAPPKAKKAQKGGNCGCAAGIVPPDGFLSGGGKAPRRAANKLA